MKNLRNKLAEIFEYYKSKIMIVLNIIAIIFGVIGSYLYYVNISEVESNRLVSVVLFSTLKLYLFSPTIGLDESVTAFYEIAKWLAPICTAVGVIKLLEFFLRRSFAEIGRIFGKVYYVFGYNNKSKLLVKSLRKEHKRVVLVSEEVLTVDQKLELGRIGVIAYIMKISGGSSLEHVHNLRKLNLLKASAIVLFYEDETKNFSILMRIVEFINKKKLSEKQRKMQVSCSVQCSDYAIKEIMSQYYKGNSGDSKNASILNLKLFSTAQMAAHQLFDKKPIYENNLNRAILAKKEKKSIDDLGRVHLLIAGFGQCGEAVLAQAMNLGTLNPKTKMRVTIFDSESMKSNLLKAKYRMLDHICEVEFINMDIRSDMFLNELDKLKGENEPTYVAICFRDQTLGMLTSLEMARRFKGITIATRIEVDNNIVKYIKGNNELYKDIYPFGVEKEIFTEEVIIDMELDQKAQKFHQRYSEMSSGNKTKLDKSMAIKAWNKLDLFKKESNRAQAGYQRYMRELLLYLNPMKGEDPEKYLLMESDTFEVESNDYKKVIKYLKENPTLEMLASLEHSRWCNFMYAHNYTYAKKEEYSGNDYKHYCLKSDWDEVLKDEKIANTIKYDVISIFTTKDLDSE